MASIGLRRPTARLMFDGTPTHANRKNVEDWLRNQTGASDLHDLHVWALSTTTTALTVHLVMAAGHPGDAFPEYVAEELAEHFGLNHASIQIETGEGASCKLASVDKI